ncbi:hypothetical protein FC26_GL000758 [Paucilactobacillus vaccinostercus DSM 20634]|jgi:hypothetical protein|uniref:Uncharacterized protein n=1 Tax=Paucilactobacillus vaccinostercus DSM 20634 TaxID=1423813 RepID=A0A0R2A6B4_9LACO|nr:hypothetical protein FC26_GL000758 [Paucilactobacillus vaccinostercus DSM 20634]
MLLITDLSKYNVKIGADFKQGFLNKFHVSNNRTNLAILPSPIMVLFHNAFSEIIAAS